MIRLIVILLGVCGGSFINALVWRLHKQSKSKAIAKYSILKGRSMCTSCKHQLVAIDLVPVFSWLWLRGKCRYCKKPISLQYPLVELLTAGLFLASYIFWPYGFELLGTLRFGLWLAILTGLIALLVYDLKWQILPNKVVFPLVGLASVNVCLVLIQTQHLDQFFVALVLSLAIASGLFYLLFQISAGRWIGGGDVKLGLVYGLLLADPIKSASVLFIASFVGSVVLLPALIKKDVSIKSKIPFGPFLIIGTIIVYLYGDQLISWYKSFLLL